MKRRVRWVGALLPLMALSCGGSAKDNGSAGGGGEPGSTSGGTTVGSPGAGGTSTADGMGGTGNSSGTGGSVGTGASAGSAGAASTMGGSASSSAGEGSGGVSTMGGSAGSGTTTGTGGNAGTSTGGAGSGGDVGTTGGSSCAGLGCPPCDTNSLSGELCASGQSCQSNDDCSLIPALRCEMNLGTVVTDFHPFACLAGECILELSGGGCIDLTPCDECNSRGCSEPPTTVADCATCCATQYTAENFADIYRACACGSGGPCETECATSTYCGGAGPETEACAACLFETIVPGGACLDSAAFQQDCMEAPTTCQRTAQCLLTCSAVE